MFQDSLRVFQGILKDVLRGFQVYMKEVHRVFDGRFKGMYHENFKKAF